MGRWIALLKPIKEEYDIFLFFPFYHIGGAEKVHAEIAKVAGLKKSIIFFTKKSHNKLFYQQFKQSGCIIKDISIYTDNKWLYFNNFIFRGIISGYINKQRGKTLVFNGQCNFGYKISPWLKKSIPQIELIHSFNSFSWIRIPFIGFYSKTIMISKVKIDEHIVFYKKQSIPSHFTHNIIYIINGIPIPEDISERNYYKKELDILYVGRGTAEKRVPLIAQLAKNCNDKNLPVSFTFMGDVAASIPEGLFPYCKCIGNKNDPNEIQQEYENADILILLSTTEGFPLTVMEAMANGLAVIATAVGDIPIHLMNENKNFLINEVHDETAILEKSILFIEKLIAERELLKKISVSNREYAINNFSIGKFDKTYQQLFDLYTQ